MHKKFDFRESFRDAVLLGFFRGAFANLSRPAFWLLRKNVRLQFCTLFIIQVFEAAQLRLQCLRSKHLHLSD